MKKIVHIDELQQCLERVTRPIGFVPTMGFLHEGHKSLVKKARDECATVVVSIFVNPTQFGPNEDLNRYPRDLPRDLGMLKTEGVDITFIPLVEEMYPENFNSWVDVEGLTNRLEGEIRPGHFRGVTTVVSKLFNIVSPQKAYFGQKDAQQLSVINKMIKDLNFPIEIIPCPTIRENDGLAMSSRNIYLTLKERQAATVLFRALMEAWKQFRDGERNAEKLRVTVKKILASEPLAEVQYVSCADWETFKEIEVVSRKTLLSLAVRIGKTRLIDNFILDEDNDNH